MLARGAKTLATQSPQAEQFVLDGETVSANCNRIPGSDDPDGVKNVSTEEGSVIWWPLNTRTVPERGTVVTDSFGHQHRVGSVKHLGNQLQLTCEVVR